MSALSTAFGYWYRLDSSGRFVPVPQAIGEADDVCCVTGGTDGENLTTQMLNATAMIPAGTTRWTVNGQALRAAFLGGTKLALTPA